MKPTARSARLVSGAAAIAMVAAAAGTMAHTWIDRQEAAREIASVPQERPAADAPVGMVRAPEARTARQLPTACRDCARAPRVLEGGL